MIDYNTHGGYFAPQGLLRINEGGSHEENPNGGIQLGVDNQGIPNLVEEDEVVYDDFVYSDNIKADGGFLEENHIPTKYAGKFYSEVAEALCDETGEQTDPITLNGLRTMLGRLANAQEAQKAAEEEAALMEELQNMSPEEIAQLEQALEQRAAQEQMIPQEQMAPEQMVPQEQVEIMPEEATPMMAMGGKIFRDGGPAGGGTGGGGRAGSTGQKALNLLREVGDFISPIEQKEITMPDGNTVTLNYAIGNAALPENIALGLERGNKLIANAAKQSDKTVARSMIKEGKRVIKFSQKMAKKAGKPVASVVESVAETIPAAEPIAQTVDAATPFLKRKGVGPFLARTGIGTGILTALGAGAKFISDTWGNPDIEGAQSPYEYDPNDFNLGGIVRKFGDGTPGEEEIVELPVAYAFASKLPQAVITGNRVSPFIQLPNSGYDVWGNGRFLPDDWAPLYGRIHSPSGEWNGNFNFDDAAVAPVDYPRPPVYDLGMMNDAIVYGQRNPGKRAGVRSSAIPVGTKPTTNPVLMDEPLPAVNDGQFDGLYLGPALTNNKLYADILKAPDAKLAPKTKFNVSGDDNRGGSTRNPSGGFDLRYLAPAIDAAMGLATAATPADRYKFNPIRPYLPVGRIRQQYERYNPIDQNLVTNKMQAQALANMSALRNAGLGPSIGANMIAADYNAEQNLGNALANVWDANNQRYNQVIAQNNTADARIADFDWGVEAARTNALNQFAPYNQRMALAVEQMNNEAMQDKYNALASYVDSAKQFFANKGREDLNRNMVNTNRAFLGYGIDSMNNVVYDKYGNPILLTACGGKIHKKK